MKQPQHVVLSQTLPFHLKVLHSEVGISYPPMGAVPHCFFPVSVLRTLVEIGMKTGGLDELDGAIGMEAKAPFVASGTTHGREASALISSTT
jgi:hypothetical protein